MSRKRLWRVVERGVNGKPFLWKKVARREYVMIDILNVRRKWCYPVVALEGNPFSKEDARRRLIGVGCGTPPRGWVGAYEQARKIADNYMNRHSSGGRTVG